MEKIKSVKEMQPDELAEIHREIYKPYRRVAKVIKTPEERKRDIELMKQLYGENEK